MRSDETKMGSEMKCPTCSHPYSYVVDSRQNQDNTVTRRRHECQRCMLRFSTWESFTDVSTLKEESKLDKILEFLKTL